MVARPTATSEVRMHGGPRRGGAFWSPRTVAWYRRALDRSDYAVRFLEAVGPLLTGARSVLDVGAGCGALALPLAGRVPRVTALEPAPAMAAALRAEARRQGLRHLAVVEAAWGDTALPVHDVVLCAHVGELTRPGAAFLGEAARWARRWVVIVKDREPGSDKFFFRELYPALLGRPYGGGCDYQKTVEALRALGLRPGSAAFDYQSDQPFGDLEEACEFYETYLDLPASEARPRLRDFLAARLVREPSGWRAPYRKRVAALWWPGQAVAGPPVVVSPPARPGREQR